MLYIYTRLHKVVQDPNDIMTRPSRFLVVAIGNCRVAIGCKLQEMLKVTWPHRSESYGACNVRPAGKRMGRDAGSAMHDNVVHHHDFAAHILAGLVGFGCQICRSGAVVLKT